MNKFSMPVKWNSFSLDVRICWHSLSNWRKNCLFFYLYLDLPWPITLSLILTFCLYWGAHLYVQNSWFFSLLMVQEGTSICIWNSICICVRNRIRVTHKILPVPSHRCDLICQVEKLVPPTPKLSLELSSTSFVFVIEFEFVFQPGRWER